MLKICISDADRECLGPRCCEGETGPVVFAFSPVERMLKSFWQSDDILGVLELPFYKLKPGEHYAQWYDCDDKIDQLMESVLLENFFVLFLLNFIRTHFVRTF